MKRTNNMKRGGSFMPPELREEIGNDPEYSRCAINTPEYVALWGSCQDRITREHAVINAGKKIQKKWAIPPFCAKHHGVDKHQDGHQEAPKEVRIWVALNRATDEELLEYPKSNYLRQRELLNARFGTYTPPPVPNSPIVQKAPPLRPRAKSAPLDEFEREARLFARDNGCSMDAARLMLTELV